MEESTAAPCVFEDSLVTFILQEKRYSISSTVRISPLYSHIPFPMFYSEFSVFPSESDGSVSACFPFSEFTVVATTKDPQLTQSSTASTQCLFCMLSISEKGKFDDFWETIGIDRDNITEVTLVIKH